MPPKTDLLPAAPRAPSPWINRVLGAGSLALLALGAALLMPAWESSKWPSVQGTVVGHRTHSELQGKTTKYGLKAVYGFTVDGVYHRAERYSHALTPVPGLYPSREAAEEAGKTDPKLEAWRIGQPVTVYFNPAAPADAVLEKAAIAPAVAVLLLALGLGAITFVQRRRPKPRPGKKAAP